MIDTFSMAGILFIVAISFILGILAGIEINHNSKK